MSMTIAQLQAYAKAKALQAHINKPVKVVVLPAIPNSHINPRDGRPDTVMRNIRNKFYPYNKHLKPHVQSYEIEVRKDYFKHHAGFKAGQEAMKAGIAHEVAHCVVPYGHGVKFRKVARKLGADERHTHANWDARDWVKKKQKHSGIFGEPHRATGEFWRI